MSRSSGHFLVGLINRVISISACQECFLGSLKGNSMPHHMWVGAAPPLPAASDGNRRARD